jgi:hypothetical protein
MSAESSFNSVMYGALAFFFGIAGVMVYNKVKGLLQRGFRADEAVVEAVVSEYTRRLRDYDRTIAELRTKIDLLELRAQQVVAQPLQQQQVSRPPQPHVASVSEPVAVTQHATEPENNGTTDYILKLLAERPRTSREVQLAVGRTREHTARLMKKLHDSGLVSRDANAKPFKYAITSSGQSRLNEKLEAAPGMPAR